MISFKFVFYQLINNSVYWSQERDKFDYILERGRLSGYERQRLETESYISLALEMDAKETLAQIVKNYRTNYRSYRIRGSQKPKNGGGYWPNFYTIIKILVAGEENLGPQEKIVNLKFNPNIKTDHLKEGFLVVEKCKCKQPRIYKITEENGIKKYPYIWIDEIYSFEEDIPEQED